MDRLLVWWIALLGATRINLLGESAEFMLSPFLVLSPLVIGLALFSTLARGGNVRVPRQIGRFVLVISLLLAVIVVSSFLSYDLSTSARRTLLLCAQIGMVVLGGLVLANRPEPRRLIVAGAVAGLTLSVVFNVLQVTYWFAGDWLPVGLSSVVSLEPGNYEGIVPRLTAVSHDPNHGGILLATHIFLIWKLGSPSRVRTALIWAGTISILLTLSRSVVLAGLVMFAVSAVRQSGLMISQKSVLRMAGVVAVLAATILLVPAAVRPLEGAWEILGGRLSLGEGSSQQHGDVVARGWEVATQDLRRMFFGVGYGNAYTTLQDIFPGNPYGNYHSLFVTLFAESGVFALALGLLLFGYPLARGGEYQPLIAGLLIFNLFQQSQTDPTFWLVLLLAWTGIGAVRDRRPVEVSAVWAGYGRGPPIKDGSSFAKG